VSTTLVVLTNEQSATTLVVLTNEQSAIFMAATPKGAQV
jgi:hypothetical protein